MVATAGVWPEAMVWRVLNGLLGATHLVLVTVAALGVFRGGAAGPRWLRIIGALAGYLTVAANAVVALGFMEAFAVVVFLASLSWLLLVSVFQFVILLVSNAGAA